MSDRARLVILNGTCLEAVAEHREYLDAQQIDWVADASFKALSSEAVDTILSGADGLILPAAIRTVPYPEQMFRNKRLKVLSIAASGYEWLDVSAATDCGIVVTHAPVREGYEVVADLTWGFILAVARQIPHYDQRVRAGCYDRGMGVSVWGKTLGIVGLGGVGKAVARRARGFEMPILAADPNPDRDFVQRHGIELTTLDELLRRSDFVSLHVRLSAETEKMIGPRELELMKPSAFLINAARWQLVDEKALIDAIMSRRLAGAAIDDPPTRRDNPLLKLPNVVYSPHMGNRAIEGVHAVFRRAIDNAVQVLRGYRPKAVVNPAVYGRKLRAPPLPARLQPELRSASEVIPKELIPSKQP
jgi:D-3-phosphoglycerate dehydrogenase / 2-oxoglutarate reductase